MRSALLVAAVLAACTIAGVVIVGCLSTPKFQCSNASDCLNDTVQGTCQMDGFCSFSDSSCASGQRYGDLSGPQGGQCVPVPPDGPPDAPPDIAIDARECFGGMGMFQLCFAGMPPMGTLMLQGTFNTDGDGRCMTPPASWIANGQPDACMVLGKTITINTLTVQGTKALIILGDVININGTLDVASHRGVPAGPGAPGGVCPAGFPTTPGTLAAGGGGGAGGSFRTKGGDGGQGDTAAANGGTANALVGLPTVLRAGCPGQAGAGGAIAGGTPGQGGGAVFVTATTLTFGANAGINASGAGGAASSQLAGGSGGGSGGMIVLHVAGTLTAPSSARVIANGGGGASGANDNGTGDFGDDPNIAAPLAVAVGGDPGGNAAGTGGNGFAGGTPATIGESAGVGQRHTGGAGGGGGGQILTNKTIGSAQTSGTLNVAANL